MEALDAMKATWGDKSISLVGLHTIVVLVLVVALTWMGILLHKSVNGNIETFNTAIDAQTKELTAQHERLTNEMRANFVKLESTQTKVAGAVETQAFLLTKSEAERKAYKIDTPEWLRERMR